MRYAYTLTSALLLGGASLTLLTGYPAAAQADSQYIAPKPGAPASFADLTEKLQPAVVNISTRQRVEVENANPFAGTPFAQMFRQQQQGAPQTQEAQSLGSGFIISADGYIVTNNHVISPTARGTVEEITVTLSDGTELEAKLIGNDPSSDLAVLKVSRIAPFPYVKFGDSSHARTGDWVVAIGNPFGFGGTVTSGIISSVIRNTGGGAYDRYIQTDASINRGNSGGPLFDMNGNVIGINNAIYSPTGASVGIGFAIPAETAAPIIDKLKSGTSIERGYLGVSIQAIDEDTADSLGLAKNKGELVQLVVPGEGADKAGIKPGDIVTKVAGKEVTREQTLSFIVANIKPGTKISLEVLREGTKKTLSAIVGKRPSEDELKKSQQFTQEKEGIDAPDAGAGSEGIVDKIGLQLVPIDAKIAGQLGVDPGTKGLAIAGVDPNSDAGKKGLAFRDIVLSANYKPVTTVKELEAIIAAAEKEGRKSVFLRVRISRTGSAVYVPVRLR